MKNVRLKTALHPQQIQNRMKFNPEIMELHLKEEHLYDREPMIHYIQEFKSKGCLSTGNGGTGILILVPWTTLIEM